MVRKVFLIHDVKMDMFEPPIIHVAVGGMIRDWLNLCRKEDVKWAKNPADFTLFQAGEFDDQSGVVTMLPTKINLGTLRELQAHDGGQ